MTTSPTAPAPDGDAAAEPTAPWYLRHRRAVGLAGAALAAVLTVVWVVVVPDKADETTGLQSWAVRLAHPLTWALLTAFGLAFAAGAPRRLLDTLAWSALGCYGVFLLATTL